MNNFFMCPASHLQAGWTVEMYNREHKIEKVEHDDTVASVHVGGGSYGIHHSRLIKVLY